MEDNETGRAHSALVNNKLLNQLSKQNRLSWRIKSV